MLQKVIERVHSLDQIKYLSAVILPVPAGFLIGYIKNPTCRLLTIALLGMIFEFFLYSFCIQYSGNLIASIIAWTEIVIVYFLCMFVKRKYVGWAATGFSLSFLIYLHIERMITDYGGWHLKVDVTAMLQLLHLSTFGWDYTDGGEDPAKLSSEQRRNAIKTLPNLLEFFAAAVSPTQSFAGPAQNYVEFRDFVYSQGIYAHIPSTIIPCLKRFATAAFFLSVYFTLQRRYPPELIYDGNFLNENFFTRVKFHHNLLALFPICCGILH
jgi:hypothetical protein